MSNESEFLTKDEMVELTGSKQYAGQIKWLDENGINYLLNGKGVPVVGRHYMRQHFARAAEAAQSETTEQVKPKAKSHQFKFAGANRK